MGRHDNPENPLKKNRRAIAVAPAKNRYAAPARNQDIA